MENSHSIENVIESAAKPDSISERLLKSVEMGDGSERTRKLMESIAMPDRISEHLLKSMEMGSTSAAMKAMESAAMRGGIFGESLSDRMLKSMDTGGVSELLTRSLEHTALLARNVDQSLSDMHISVPTARLSHEGFEVPTIPELPPNPIWQTNTHLSELTGTVMQLVDVARQQAELSQAIRTSADLALKYAIQSGEDAKAATLLARKGVRLTLFAIMVAILVGFVSIAASYRLSNSTDVRLKEEIRLLDDISHNLQQLNDKPVSNPVTRKPQTEPNKGGQGASAR